MRLYDLADQFLVSAKAERGFTPDTIRTFRSRIRAYCRFCGEDAGLSDFSLPLLKRYLYHLATQNKRPRTIKANFDALRSFGHWLVAEGAVNENYASAVSTPKLDAVRREMVTDDEVRDLLAACGRIHGKERAALCRAVLSVFVFCGLRREEGLSLKMDDVSLAQQCLIIRQGKGQKSRTIYPHPDCLSALREWLRLRPQNCSHDYLFAYDPGRRVHVLGLRTIFEELSVAAGISKPIHAHDLRHAFARRALQNGMDIASLQNILGHNHLSTTAMYIRTDDFRLREVAVLGGIVPREPMTVAKEARVTPIRKEWLRSRRTSRG